MVFHFIICEKTSKLLIYELCTIVVPQTLKLWYFEMSENIPLDKLLSLCCRDGGQWFCFYPLGEVVDCYNQALHLF